MNGPAQAYVSGVAEVSWDPRKVAARAIMSMRAHDRDGRLT